MSKKTSQGAFLAFFLPMQELKGRESCSNYCSEASVEIIWGDDRDQGLRVATEISESRFAGHESRDHLENHDGTESR